MFFKRFRAVYIFLIFYLLLFATYYLTSVNLQDRILFLQMRRFVPCALVLTLSIYFWRLASFKLKCLIPYVIVDFAWLFVYNICYCSGKLNLDTCSIFFRHMII